MHPDDIARLEAVRQKALADGLPFEIEQRMRGKDDKYRWFLLRYVPFKDDGGRILRWYTGATPRSRSRSDARPTWSRPRR